ncbi:Acg family FMN-binding oxidoreductase [Mycobacterium sp. ITM-2016-00318]|uniref:Acg family FMN-binding oxidoreductase n=1 Tax=Mycobacterium sp. ITM-2016-00318 TaxID=2099693 RepID=UPI000CF8AA55|nr:NAD(P)H nitroreductase [Mycobacterium sp. ITM-2016-00318]WNG91846.1 NAD(P)H nitroreductase [Mycobacterium sp. ITM-2016-00318]
MRDTVVEQKIIHDAVELACRAPSLHNSQPWRWRADGDVVELHVDPDRAPRRADPSGREALIACGAALDHFRVAMAAAGWTANIDRFPNPNDFLHLASVDFTPMEFVTDAHRRLADAIIARRTDRLPFSAPPNWDPIELGLRKAIDSDKIFLDVIADDLRQELAEASQLAETFRLYDSGYHSELVGWTADFKLHDGIPQSSLISASESDRVDVGRNFPVTHGSDRRPQVDQDHAKVVVLSSDDSTHDDVLRCGEALSAVLLEATLAGLATCTLTHLTEVLASRMVVATLIGRSTTPQVLIRVGLTPSIGESIPPTPRRPLSEVLYGA